MGAQRETAKAVPGTVADSESVLGDFLRAHRARITPEEAGVNSYGIRRVPGLRREELAQIAGVSANYYTRLEQGEAMNPSTEVIGALARALMLDPDATAYLHTITGTAPRGRGAEHSTSEAEQASLVQFDRLVQHMPGTASITLSLTNDVLCCNRLAHRLFFDHLPLPDERDRPWNTHRLLFMDSFTRALYRDWHKEACLAVASLRFDAAAHPADPTVRDLVGELAMSNSEFARLWAEHPVQRCTRGYKHLAHPEHGEIDLEFQVVHAPEDDGRRILVHTAMPNTGSAEILERLTDVEASERHGRS